MRGGLWDVLVGGALWWMVYEDALWSIFYHRCFLDGVLCMVLIGRCPWKEACGRCMVCSHSPHKLLLSDLLSRPGTQRTEKGV